MPEIWIPYGGVETLVTLQAENLGSVAETVAEAVNTETERTSELVKGSSQLFVCDGAPATLEFLKSALAAVGESQALKIHSPAPKRLETAIPELKGRVTTLGPPLPTGQEEGLVYAPELLEAGPKLFVGSARPDPVFGIMDTKVEACLNWIAHSRSATSGDQAGMGLRPFRRRAPTTPSKGWLAEWPMGSSSPSFRAAARSGT